MRFLDEPSCEAYDVVVVGAGIGGLCTGALLAAAGRRVLVVERHDRVGGYAHSFRRGPYLFDSCVHMIGGCEAGGFEGGSVIHEVLRGLDLQGRCHFERLDPLYRSVLPDLDLRVPASLDELERELADEFPAERKGIGDFLQACLDIRQQTHRASMLRGAYDVMKSPKRFPTLLRLRRATLQEVLDGCIESPHLKAVLGTLWPYLGLPPSRVSFLYYATMLMSYVADHAYYCRGSFQSLADALASAISERGGELLLRSCVRRIDVERGRTRGVVLENGMHIAAPTVVSNADALQTVHEMVGEPAFPSSYIATLDRMRPSISAFVLYLAAELDLRGSPLAHENFFFSSNDHDAAWRSTLAGSPEWFSMTVPTLADPSLAPAGQHLLVLTTLVPYALGRSWRALKPEIGEHLLGLAEAQVGGLRERLRFRESGTPRTLERYSRNTDGAMYGWELSPSQVGPGRVGPTTPVDGLFLAGHWSQPGGGIYGVVTSGMQTARAVLGLEREQDLWQALGSPS